MDNGDSQEGEEGGEGGEGGAGGEGGSGGSENGKMGKGGPREGGTKVPKGEGRLRPEDFGVARDDWLKVPSQLRKDLLQGAEGRAPEEFRDLIQDYFSEIARQGATP